MTQISEMNDEELAEIIFDSFNHAGDTVDAAWEELHARGYSNPDEVM